MYKLSLFSYRLVSAMYSLVTLFKRVREKAGYSPTEMAELFDRSIQSYLHAENKGKRYTLFELLQLGEIYIENGGSLESFWKLVEVSARRDK